MNGAPAFSHEDIDRRILRLVTACVARIEENPKMMERARGQVAKYSNVRLREEWDKLLDLPWAQLRSVLLEKSHEGDRIRQSVPFGGFLSNEERMRIIKSS